jgi:hypothetical protein
MFRLEHLRKAELVARVRELWRENAALFNTLYGVTPDTITHTLERDMRAGQTILVRVPKRFVVDTRYFR